MPVGYERRSDGWRCAPGYAGDAKAGKRCTLTWRFRFVVFFCVVVFSFRFLVCDFCQQIAVSVACGIFVSERNAARTNQIVQSLTSFELLKLSSKDHDFLHFLLIFSGLLRGAEQHLLCRDGAQWLCQGSALLATGGGYLHDGALGRCQRSFGNVQICTEPCKSDAQLGPPQDASSCNGVNPGDVCMVRCKALAACSLECL